MRKLAEVEEAKALMVEAAKDWSVLKWLREKKRVRKAADKANDALDLLEKEVKASWGPQLRQAYELLSQSTPVAREARKGSNGATAIPAELQQLAREVKAADERAYQAHLDAEETFDKAERILSTSMAREGSRKAIESWDLHEAAIRKAEAGVPSGSVAPAK